MSDDKKDSAPAEKSAAVSSDGGAGGGKLSSILAIVNLLVTLGIGGIVFMQFQKEKHHEAVSDISTEGEHGAAAGGEHGAAAPAAGEHGAPADAHGGGGLLSKGPQNKIVTLEQFTVNLSTTIGTPPRFARVVIAVDVPSEDTSQELTQKMPQVRNAIIDLFNSKRPSDLQTGEGRNFLKEEIRNALNSFLITGKVKGIFFSNFAVSN
jgi:flagellar FliL protein